MKNFEINTSEGAVGLLTMSRAQFIAALECLNHSSEVETLTGAGAVSLAVKTTRLDKASGTAAITIASGTVEGMEKAIVFVTVGGSGQFTLTGTFWDWTTLSFDVNGRTAILQWRAGKWLLVAGNVNVS